LPGMLRVSVSCKLTCLLAMAASRTTIASLDTSVGSAGRAVRLHSPRANLDCPVPNPQAKQSSMSHAERTGPAERCGRPSSVRWLRGARDKRARQMRPAGLHGLRRYPQQAAIHYCEAGDRARRDRNASLAFQSITGPLQKYDAGHRQTEDLRVVRLIAISYLLGAVPEVGWFAP